MRSLSQDLRGRFLHAVATGASARAAGRRFALSPTTAIRWAKAGSVRSRASKYHLCWVEAGVWSSGFQKAQHGHGSPDKEQPAAIGGARW